MNQLKLRSTSEIPALYSNTREKDPIAFVRLNAPWMNTSWYVFEWNGKDKIFALRVQMLPGGAARSYGLYSLNDLSKLEGPFGMTVFQDRAFQPIHLSELRRMEKKKQLER